MKALIDEWEGEDVIVRFDEKTGAWIFVALHSSALGIPTGGTRMMTYGSPTDALQDAMKLSEAMTRKWALVDFPRGGAKAVLHVPGDLGPIDRRGLVIRYGDFVEKLGGRFETGADLGMSARDMNDLGARTRYVCGTTPDVGGAGEAGIFTARGVFYSMLATAEYIWGTRDLTGKSVLVQGLGNVGMHLVGLLCEIGVTVKVSDLEPERVRESMQLGEVEYVPADNVYGAECDIFAPCATGGTLNLATIPQLQCRAVVGAANNQLASSEDAELLRERGIVYAPDYVTNAGAAIALPALERMGWRPEKVWQRLRGIGEVLLDIYDEAARLEITTMAVAHRMAQARIDQARS